MDLQLLLSLEAAFQQLFHSTFGKVKLEKSLENLREAEDGEAVPRPERERERERVKSNWLHASEQKEREKLDKV